MDIKLADISNYKVVFGISLIMITIGSLLLFFKVKDPKLIKDS